MTPPPRDKKVADIIQPTPNQVWIAGGAARLWWQGASVGRHDIDVFCADRHIRTEVVSRLKQHGFEKTYTSDNAITLTHRVCSQDYKVQIVKKYEYTGVQHIFDVFDFTVCQVAWDGETWYLGERTEQDLAHRVLHINAFHEAQNLPSRIYKYFGYGFILDPESTQALRSHLDQLVMVNSVEY